MKLVLSFVIVALLASVSAFAQNQFEKTSLGEIKPMDDSEPVMLTASEMTYDRENEIVTAHGNVEVVQGETVLIADQIVYEKKSGVVTARGNVSMMEASGNVVFADEVTLTDDMSAGVIEQFKARLSDGSLFAATRAKKIDENVTELTQAVYSPCKVCDNDPLWQIKADQVKIDELEQQVTYDDVDLEVYGVPVFYSPYLSHATPGADNKSGLLTPEFKLNGNLGSVFKIPAYYAIAPDRDATITPIYTTQEGLVMTGEYRQKFDDGDILLDGSVTRPQDRNGLGQIDPGKEIRGHANARGTFTFNDNADWGFDLRRTTDDTYLRRYGFSGDTLLTSRAYARGFDFMETGSRSYANVQGLAFQGLTAGDNADRIPLIAPLAGFNYASGPGLYNSRFTLDASAMMLTRDIGAESRRLAMIGGWKLPYITPSGQIIELGTSLRGDVYSVGDVPLSNGKNFDGATGRLIPEATLSWRYPFLNRMDDETSMLLEPVVALAVSPRGGNPEKIPNEDSLVPEFTDSNLFAANRYAGYDRVETGPRLSYGLRGQAQFLSSYYADWLFGQHYRVETDRAFPFSNDLDDHFSDYVGKLGLQSDLLTLAYRTRLDKENLSPKRSEVDGSLNYDPITLTGSYLSLTNDPVLASKEEAYGSAGLKLTREWQVTTGGRWDIQNDQITSVDTNLIFQNECTYVTSTIGRQYTRDRDVKPTTTFFLRVALKNLE